jgi:hypothetical protein
MFHSSYILFRCSSDYSTFVFISPIWVSCILFTLKRNIFSYLFCGYLFRLNQLSFWVALFSCGIYIYGLLIEAFYDNTYLWIALGIFSSVYAGIYLTDLNLSWIVWKCDVRIFVVYIIFPLLCWICCFVLGCAESLPESRGLKVSYRKCTSYQFFWNCIQNIFSNTCQPIKC